MAKSADDLQGLDIDAILAAIIADDPAAALHAESIVRSLRQAKAGEFTKKTVFSPVVQIRLKTGLSQSGFAQALGISVNTLRSWEQGKRNPSGAAATLLKAVDKNPRLLEELEQI